MRTTPVSMSYPSSNHSRSHENKALQRQGVKVTEGSEKAFKEYADSIFVTTLDNIYF